MPQQPLTHMLPRHLEIMRRLVLGQRQCEIAQDMSITQARMSQIINSPLFQVELRRMQNQRNEKLFKIQEELIEASLKGVKLHKQIISDKKMDVDIRQRSATSVLQIVGRITRTSQGSEGGEYQEPYEKRLKEVIFREETVTSGGISESLPEPQGELEGDSELDNNGDDIT